MSNKLIATFLVAILMLSGGSAMAPAAGANEHVTDDEHSDARENLQQQQPVLILVFADDYRSGVSFEVMNRLPQGTVNDILDGDGGSVVSNPTEYTGYVVELQPNDDVTSEYTFVFVRDGRLSSDIRYQLNDDVTVFSTELNLLQVGIEGDGSSSESTPEEDESTPGEETTAPEEDIETPEEGDDGETETDVAANGAAQDDETAQDDTAEESTEAVDADEGGFLSGLADFLGQLFDGDSDDQSQTTTVEGGLVR